MTLFSKQKCCLKINLTTMARNKGVLCFQGNAYYSLSKTLTLHHQFQVPNDAHETCLNMLNCLTFLCSTISSENEFCPFPEVLSSTYKYKCLIGVLSGVKVNKVFNLRTLINYYDV